MECLPPFLRDMYEGDFRVADAGFHNGRLAATTSKRQLYWTYWTHYVTPLRLDPYLQNTPHTTQVRAITGFAGRVRTSYYGRGRTITAPAVNMALTAIGTTIALATGTNPTKLRGAQDKLIPRLAQMLAGFRKDDPPTIKKLPVEVDIPEYIALCSLRPAATEHEKATADLILIAFYYLLWVGEYTMKGTRNDSKQTIQFQLRHITFFARDSYGRLRQLPRTAPDHDILNAESATLRLENQKNGWKGVCIHQETNGDAYHCPVRALGRRFLHIRHHTKNHQAAPLSSFFSNNEARHVTDKDISSALKLAAVALEYPTLKGIPIDRIDTHSLRSGGANALALCGYSDREIQKMGRWRSATFKEYIREELNIYSQGMSTKMKRRFNFVNIAGGVYHDVTATTIATQYTVNTVAAAA